AVGGGVRQARRRRCRGAHVLWGGPRGQLPARRILRGQNFEGRKARRFAGRAAHEVRAGDQFEDGKSDRSEYPAVHAVSGGQGDQMRRGASEKHRMKKKITVLTLSAMLFALCGSVEAQQPKKVPRIGILSSGSPSSSKEEIEPFRQGLRDLGYIEGQNITIERRYAEGMAERLPDLAAELVHLKVDVMVVSGSPSTQAAMNATKAIPIVMTNTNDPVGVGLVASLAHPGGNVTGLS